MIHCNLKYNINTFGLLSGIKFSIKDFKHSRERCQYCGWYLHSQLVFKGIDRPSYMTYWKEDDGKWVCSRCHYVKEIIKGKE